MTPKAGRQVPSYEQVVARETRTSPCRDWGDVARIAGRLQQEREILKRFLSIRFGEVREEYLRRVAIGTMEDCIRWNERLFHARTIEAVFPDHE